MLQTDELKQRIEEKLRNRRSPLTPPRPAPRYDEVYTRGTAWLDSQADPQEGRP
jgi:hypothetical protein